MCLLLAGSSTAVPPSPTFDSVGSNLNETADVRVDSFVPDRPALRFGAMDGLRAYRITSRAAATRLNTDRVEQAGTYGRFIRSTNFSRSFVVVVVFRGSSAPNYHAADVVRTGYGHLVLLQADGDLYTGDERVETVLVRLRAATPGRVGVGFVGVRDGPPTAAEPLPA
ncbi:hypothetical protein [Halorarius litoreus]|uniref:hypothetical protein n=1 Tax=Halorarius litoreus TaxID=2962676 RepID=UPI0020CDD08C|nr:hypothetical protein [Halorarius litoreus]